jgi:S-formylglutathione hydrolase FrmB
VDALQRGKLVMQMGNDVGMYANCAQRGEWPAARMWLTRLVAAVGTLAMEVDEADPVERAN